MGCEHVRARFAQPAHFLWPPGGEPVYSASRSPDTAVSNHEEGSSRSTT